MKSTLKSIRIPDDLLAEIESALQNAGDTTRHNIATTVSDFLIKSAQEAINKRYRSKGQVGPFIFQNGESRRGRPVTINKESEEQNAAAD